ncbi:MAG TPA: 3-oxoacyl-[acyl-carrier-protein] reductase [Symbiobacteriaceae bacterium]|nr:3-oxoacyl-[acyl-carrier-protein] reductase [Symbiobacteriaceae bacterium]
MRFTGKVALVTGGSRGIGRGVAERLAQEGAQVALTYVSKPDAAEAAVAAITAAGGRAKAYQVDVTDEEQVRTLYEAVLADFDRVDILVNSAGVTADAYLMMMSKNSWQKVIDTNLNSLYHMCKPVVPIMLRQRSGAIINITSIGGMSGTPGQTNYTAAKAGIIAFTRSLALELAAKNIRVNAVAPGFVETDMLHKVPPKLLEEYVTKVPVRRFATPDEIASVVAFLASPEASYIVGQTLVVDGGVLA